MIKRNVTTTFMVVAAGVLMFSGIAMATQKVPAVQVPAADSQFIRSADDRLTATSSPELEPGDDNGTDATAEPTLDDKGGQGADDATSPTASPDDKGGHGADDATSPKATPDDKGSHGADDSTKPKAPKATPDDKGGHGGGSDDGGSDH
jgi:hypothetical protein